MRVHAESHGHVAIDIIEVDLSAVEAFLGRIADPAAQAPAAAADIDIVVSDAVRRDLPARFDLKALGPCILKGFAEPVALYEVEWSEGRGHD